MGYRTMGGALLLQRKGDHDRVHRGLHPVQGGRQGDPVSARKLVLRGGLLRHGAPWPILFRHCGALPSTRTLAALPSLLQLPSLPAAAASSGQSDAILSVCLSLGVALL